MINNLSNKSKKKPKKIDNISQGNLILIGTGGTGGHVHPAISIAKSLLLNNHNVEFVIDSRTHHFLLKTNFKIKYLIPIKSISEMTILKKIISIIKAVYHFIILLFILVKSKPKLVITFGGFASLPLSLAAIFTKTKLIIHEQNSYLGRTNKIFGYFAKVIILSFEKTMGIPRSQKKKTIFAAFPVRDNFYNYIKDKKNNSNSKGNSDYNVLILAGSQGAQSFDNEIPLVLLSIQNEIREKSIDSKLVGSKIYKTLSVCHQARRESITNLVDFYKKNNIKAKVFNYDDNIDKLLKRADLVISRSGASCLFEIIFLAKPAILVPYPYAANNHQFINAKFLADSFGAKILIYDKKFNLKLKKLILSLIYDKDVLKKMMTALRDKFNFDKNKKIIKTIEGIL